MSDPESAGWACDTSVAVAAVDPDHEAHDVCHRVVAERRPVLAGHAAIETYSVLTRLPPPQRVDPADAAALLRAAFGDACGSDLGDLDVVDSLAAVPILGGAAYDALVGLAAKQADRTLLTRDQRAQRTYRSLGVTFEHVG